MAEPKIVAVPQDNNDGASRADTVAAITDKRLDRLFDYTKFHISLCLSASGGLVTLIGTARNSDVIMNLVGSPRALGLALATMIVAALAGGVIASACVSCRSFNEFWYQRQGPFAARWFQGRIWAAIEHGTFWLSVLLIAGTVLSKSAVLRWLVS